MSDYGNNFGFRRSEPRVSEGRFKTPVGASLLQGTLVEIDPASPGYLKQSAINAAPVAGYCGLLVQEEFIQSIYGPEVIDSFALNIAKPNKLSVITSGAGVKVWLKNTPSITRADGRVISAVTVVDTTGVGVGDELGWDGTKFLKVNGSTVTAAVAKVTQVSSGYVEAVLAA